jgi:hypothetical protein
MTKEELRLECERLWACETIDDSKELLNIYLEYFFRVFQNNKDNQNTTLPEHEAWLINQMIFTKSAHLKQIIEGIEFTAGNGSVLRKIIDTTIVASLIRNLYETVGMFNIIYVNTKSADEKTILYNLWVHAGLKFRQRFEPYIIEDEGRVKLEDESIQLLKLVEEIENTELYKNLSDKNKGKIQSKLSEKDFKIQFKDNNVEFLSWQDLIKPLCIRERMMGQIYTYFSLYSHPSNVAVFQFGDMFQQENPQFIELTNFNIKNAFFLLSVFVADYIKLFPDVINIFNGMDLKSQIVINFYNTLARGQEFSINDAPRHLE